jgi:hypothetical protein
MSSGFTPGKLHTSGTLGDTLEPFNPADPARGVVADDVAVPSDRMDVDTAPTTADKIVAIKCEPRRMCELQFRVGHATEPNNTVNTFAIHGVNAMPNGTGNQKDGNRWTFQRRLLMTATLTCGNTALTATQIDALVSAADQVGYPVWKSVDTITVANDYTRDGATVLYDSTDGLACVQFDHGTHQFLEIELASAADTALLAEYRFLSH